MIIHDLLSQKLPARKASVRLRTSAVDINLLYVCSYVFIQYLVKLGLLGLLGLKRMTDFPQQRTSTGS
jgi:hypothetical protein